MLKADTLVYIPVNEVVMEEVSVADFLLLLQCEGNRSAGNERVLIWMDVFQSIKGKGQRLLLCC